MDLVRNTMQDLQMVSQIRLLCIRFVKVGDDGHMRLYCCGKAVTGIGNVPKWEPVRRGKQG